MNEKKPRYIDGVGWRYESEHSMLHRMQLHDYQSRSIYMITMSVEGRRHLLGELRFRKNGDAQQSLRAEDAYRRFIAHACSLAYHADKRKITRQQCLALNDMSKQISTEPWTQELEKDMAELGTILPLKKIFLIKMKENDDMFWIFEGKSVPLRIILKT